MRQPAPTDAELAVLDPDGRFRNRLAADRAELVALARQSPSPGQLAEIGRIVHQLAGAAGTFGFAEIGELAIALDDTLIDGAPLADAKPMIAGLLTALAAV
jgi:HPt (histidine-containing phosphotransfer) domain-containing protein